MKFNELINTILENNNITSSTGMVTKGVAIWSKEYWAVIINGTETKKKLRSFLSREDEPPSFTPEWWCKEVWNKSQTVTFDEGIKILKGYYKSIESAHLNATQLEIFNKLDPQARELWIKKLEGNDEWNMISDVLHQLKESIGDIGTWKLWNEDNNIERSWSDASSMLGLSVAITEKDKVNKAYKNHDLEDMVNF